jgi:hypothetical protein
MQAKAQQGQQPQEKIAEENQLLARSEKVTKDYW